MTQLFTSAVCDHCDEREQAVARALYRESCEFSAQMGLGLGDESWEDLEDEARDAFTRFARAAIKALEGK